MSGPYPKRFGLICLGQSGRWCFLRALRVGGFSELLRLRTPSFSVSVGVSEEVALSFCLSLSLPVQCSTTCGLGAYWRHVECSTQVDSDCAAIQRPDPMKRCHLRPCARWKVGNWSKVTDETQRYWGMGVIYIDLC